MLALGCATARGPEAPPVPPPLPASVLVSDLRVALSETLPEADRAALLAAEIPSVLRFGALDWFDHVERFDVRASLVLFVEVREVHLRSQLSTWLWPERVAPDRLRVLVRFRDATGFWRHEDFEWLETTRVGGWDWRDPQDRLERMARRLGRRIAELLVVDAMLDVSESLPR